MSVYAKWILALLSGLLIVGAIWGGLHWYDGQIAAATTAGTMTERAKWEQEQAARNATALAGVQLQAQANAAKAIFQQQVNLITDQEHEKAIADLQNRNADLIAQSGRHGGLRISRAVCNAGPSANSAAAGTQAAGDGSDDAYLAGTVALPDDTQRALWALALEADTIVEDYRTTQDWIKRNGFYGTFKMPDAAVPSPAVAASTAGAP